MNDDVKRATRMPVPDHDQTIARLTPLADALAMLADIAKPVAARERASAQSASCVLAADVVAPRRPLRPSALLDGWAVQAEALIDASSYAPVALAAAPTRVETGDELPAGADAVVPPDFIVMRKGLAEAVSAVAPGDGVLPAGGDIDPAKPLRVAGERIRSVDVALLQAANVTSVSVRRPRVRIATAREDLRLRPAVEFMARDIAAQGGEASVQNGADVGEVLQSDDADAFVIVGGSGTGARDASVTTLAQAGRVIWHGIGLAPGETAAFGVVGEQPVLIVPGRLDAALAVWLVLGRRMLASLAGAGLDEATATYKLSRKVASTVGIAELVPVRRAGDGVEPLAAKVLTLSALARADGFLVVPADSEGYAAGAQVAVRQWP